MAVKTSPKQARPAAKSSGPKKSAKTVDQRFEVARRASILLKHVSDPTRLQVILTLRGNLLHLAPHEVGHIRLGGILPMPIHQVQGWDQVGSIFL